VHAKEFESRETRRGRSKPPPFGGLTEDEDLEIPTTPARESTRARSKPPPFGGLTDAEDLEPPTDTTPARDLAPPKDTTPAKDTEPPTDKTPARDLAPPTDTTPARRVPQSRDMVRPFGGAYPGQPSARPSPPRAMATTPATEENGGDPFVSPGGSKHGPRHVKAHDGFHNIEHEPRWRHWNDRFTTSWPKGQKH